MKKHLLATAAVIMLAGTFTLAACEKDEETTVQPTPGKVSLVNTVWEGKMEITMFEDSYWEETMVFLSDTSVLVFRKSIDEGELANARTIQTGYSFDGESTGKIFTDEPGGGVELFYDTIDGEITLTVNDYYPHILHRIY